MNVLLVIDRVVRKPVVRCEEGGILLDRSGLKVGERSHVTLPTVPRELPPLPLDSANEKIAKISNSKRMRSSNNP
ncbi:hypothetical protein J6590_027332 [Homalodisca vitripennis]|nr:hypothetical protein J6590_027332 [Homalodisca vitripennis]